MTHGLASLPTPSLNSALLAAEYWLRPARFLDRCEQLGDRFVVRMPGLPPLVGVTAPADVRAVFTGDQTALHLGEGLKKMAPHELVLGSTSITVKDDEAHLQDRRILTPYFGGAALMGYEAGMARKTRELMRAWPLDEPVPFQRLMMQLTLEIIIATVFGVTEPERARRVREAVLRLVGVVGGPGFLAFSILAVARGGRWDGTHRRLRAAMAEVDGLAREELAARRAAADFERPDVLTALLRAQGEHGEAAMSDLAICDLLRTLLIAGYETTASSLAWIVERATRHPHVLAELEASVGRGEDGYVDAVVAEGMRVRSVAPFTLRLVVKPFELEGLRLEPGVIVAPFIALVHRRPDVYPDPHVFRPERFLGTKPGMYTWIPFGGGVRRCLGGPFALLEMRVVLRTILEELRFLPTREADEPLGRRNVTIVPGRGAIVTLGRRLRAAA